MVGIPMIASTTQAIAQPTEIPKTEKENVIKIEKTIAIPPLNPSKDEIAQEQIAQRQAELAKQEALEEAEAAKTAVTTVTQVATQAVSYNVEQWRPIVAKYPWPVDQAMLVLARESGGNPRAVSKTDDHGLFQIHGGLATYGEKIYDPEFNVALAYNNYYKTRGWRPWYSVQGILW